MIKQMVQYCNTIESECTEERALVFAPSIFFFFKHLQLHTKSDFCNKQACCSSLHLSYKYLGLVKLSFPIKKNPTNQQP